MISSGKKEKNTKEIAMPPKREDTSTVSVVHEICAGLDVHKRSVSACLVFSDSEGNEQELMEEFETFTDDLTRLREWLLEHNCPVVAIESTGPYWTPVHNIVEDYVEVILVNPKHFKNLRGRKTDISDSRWLAGLLRHGLLAGGFIPPKFQRQWRDLTRMRTRYVQTQGDFKRRVHKLFQQCNIKIDSVVTHLFGLTGRNLMNLLISQEGSPSLPEVQACLRGSLSHKAPELHRAVQGFFEEHHREMLRILFQTIDALEDQIRLLDHRIDRLMKEHGDALERLKEVPGVSDVSARAILSEIGPGLEAFPSAGALASWCGLCPGNNQSAGKRRTGHSRVRNNHLKTIMVEVAWPAIKKKGSYYKAKYYALKARLGPKKAIIAIAHRILKAIYHVLKHGKTFRDLGEAFLLERNRASKLRYVRKQASLLGYHLVPVNHQPPAPILGIPSQS